MQAIKLFFAIVAALLAADGVQRLAGYMADVESPTESVSIGLPLEKTLTEIKRELKIFSQTLRIASGPQPDRYCARTSSPARGKEQCGSRT